MKNRFPFLAVLVAAALSLLPSGEVQSQTPGMEIFSALQELVSKNEALLKRQEETAKTVEDLLIEAKQARIMTKRG